MRRASSAWYEITVAGGAAHGFVVDLTKDDDARRVVWDTVRHFKGLDFALDLAITLNLRTVLIMTEAAIPESRARGGGSLLFTAFASGLVGSGYSPVY
jgi:hypothetical protein